MFLTMLDHDGRTWKVELRSLAAEESSGVLEFAFSRRAAPGEPECLSWRITGDSLEELSCEGTAVSEDLLRRQLAIALEVARTGGSVAAA